MRADPPSTLTTQQLRILITLLNCPGASLASYPIIEIAAVQARCLIAPNHGDQCGFNLTEQGRAIIEQMLNQAHHRQLTSIEDQDSAGAEPL